MTTRYRSNYLLITMGTILFATSMAWSATPPGSDRTAHRASDGSNVRGADELQAVEQALDVSDIAIQIDEPDADDGIVVSAQSSNSSLAGRDEMASTNITELDGGIRIQIGATADAAHNNERQSDIGSNGHTVAMAFDEASSQLSFQALLTDNVGNPLGENEVKLEFSIYDGIGNLITDPIGPFLVPMNNGIVDTAIPVLAKYFDGTARELGVSVDGEPELTPRVKLVAVPYAFRVDRVASEELDDNIEMGSASANGKLTVWDGGSGVEAIRLGGSTNTISTWGDDGNERIRLWGPEWGEVLLFDGTGNNRTVRLSSGPDAIIPNVSPYHEFGGQLTLSDGAGGDTIFLGGETATVNTTGGFQLVDTIGSTATVYGELSMRSGGAQIDLADELGTRALLGGASASAGGYLNLYQKDGGVGLELDGDASNNDGGGDIAVFQADGGIGVFLDGDSSGAGFVGVRNAGGSNRVQLDGESTGTGGRIIVSDASGSTTVDIFGAETDMTGGKINIEDAGSRIRVSLDGESTGTGGEISVFDSSGTETIELLGDESNGGEGHGQIMLRSSAGVDRIEIDAVGSSGARIHMMNANGSGIIMDGEVNGGGRIRVRNSANVSRIFIDGDFNNTGLSRIRADVFRVQGGVDLAEPFECKDEENILPGMVMSIDPISPGKLMMSTEAYDRKVAGIVSGAGGVRPGITLSQDGVMDKGQLVALTGRVYCLADASSGAIRPGDMLTTSMTPGYAMKVNDYSKAHGATIGKAMTSLETGKGLILVLVQPH